jgi:hypothetical protein
VKHVPATNQATIYSLDHDRVGTVHVDGAGKLIIIATNPAEQQDLARHIRGKYRAAKRRMEDKPFDTILFMQDIHRWASGTMYSIVQEPRVTIARPAGYQPFAIDARPRKPRPTIQLHETSVNSKKPQKSNTPR